MNMSSYFPLLHEKVKPQLDRLTAGLQVGPMFWGLRIQEAPKHAGPADPDPQHSSADNNTNRERIYFTSSKLE
jgi:hypothetical protein